MILGLLALLSLTANEPTTANIAARERFETPGGSVSRDSIVQENLDLIRDLANRTATQSKCKFRDQQVRCWPETETTDTLFASPYPAAADTTSLAPDRDDKYDVMAGYFPILSDRNSRWVPVGAVMSGSALVADYRRRLTTGRPFSCHDGGCMVIASLIPGPGLDEMWGLCGVYAIAHMPYSPSEDGCVGIFARSGTEEWLQAYIADIGIGDVGYPDFSINLTGATAISLPRLRRQMNTALTSPPLSLNTKIIGTSILGSSVRRTSIVDTAYRERITIRLDFTTSGARIDRPVEVTLSTTVYINRLNTSAPEDWHLPTPTQQERYVSLLLRIVKKAITAVCDSPHWMDTYTISCGLEH